MIIITKNSESFPLEKNEICILCEASEKIPVGFIIDENVYASKMAAVIPYEFVQKGITVGSIFEHNTCIIYGCDQADSFKRMKVSGEEIKKVCKDIWDNPDKYSDYKKESDAAYYNFLKYLYVKFPNGKEKSLYEVTKS